MSLFARRQQRTLTGPTAEQMIPSRMGATTAGAVTVTNDSALRHSAVWACLRLRADLISTMPVDVYRRFGGLQLEVPKPPVLVTPGGERWDYCDWMYATQFDLDRAGNAVGLVTERNALGLPSRIDLAPISEVGIVERKDTGLQYRISGTLYPPSKVWHERQFVVAGLPFGLSPVAYAAWSIGEYQSAQQFALDWYGSGGIPKAQLRNTERTVTSDKAGEIKDRFQAGVTGRGVFVTGNDWEYKPIQAEATGMEWLEAKKFGIGDIARFFGCPGDFIDAAVTTGSITYANVTQRNLQFLIMHLGPAIFRREKNLSKLLPSPRYVKLNTSALLRMDDQTRADVIAKRIESRTLVPSEAREFENQAPFTAEQVAELYQLFGSPGGGESVAATVQKAYLGVGKVITADEAREIVNAAGANLPVPGPAFPAAVTPTFGVGQ